jgi:GT2 family glycosyltransferase
MKGTELLTEKERQLEKKIAEQQKMLDFLNIELNIKKEQYSFAIADIEEIKNSNSYKVAKLLSRMTELLIPHDSKRRKIFKFIFRAFKTKFKSKTKKLKNKRVLFSKLVFTQTEAPLVSIIIPAYNNFTYTYDCLRSILKYSANIKYEIIIADDNSTDKTKKINNFAKNIKIIRNDENLRFLKNCNNAANSAKGKYILFLNNDTQVQNNWLSSLVELMENDETIGLAGSKLIYPDGKLQEAGGIIWRDGSAMNYGNGSDPKLPEFNYVKEIDYISGASIIVRRTIWEEIGGFDETFAPAYYEDVDLAFSVRKAGYRVLYQPASVVVHFEGITNGTNTLEGQKKYQVINKKKFYDKWKDILEKEHFPNDENIFLARDRSRNKKILLMIDHRVPMSDKDAGSRTIFQYLKLFVDIGFIVKFIGYRYIKEKFYITVLEQLGIEVLNGIYYKYKENYKSWLATNGKFINYALLSRPNISIKYIDEVRLFSKAKIIFLGIDLHYLRESREYNVTKDEKKLKSSEEWKEIEFSLMKKSDVSYYYSTVEIDKIKEIDSSLNCKTIPLNIFPKKELQAFDNARKNIMFVGGLGYSPNVDGIIWFVDKIMPLIRNAIPGTVLHIIGSDAPYEIIKLKKNDVKVLGYLEDDKLDEYYKKCRICVAPLRYGAGVKGKVLEALYKQIPLVTTTIGAEGLPGIEECVIIEDNHELFAEKLINIYKDDNALKNMTEKGYHYINKNFTAKTVMNILSEDIEITL